MAISTEPIPTDDEALRRALEDAHVPALLPALAQLTGDLSLLRDDLRPDPTNLFDPQGGLTAEKLAEARALAFDVLTKYRDGGAPAAPPAGRDSLRQSFEFLAGRALEEDVLQLCTEELGVSGEDLRRPAWRKDELAPDRPFTVAVIGAGMSGLAAAHRLKQAEVPFVVLEKNDDVGGTWLENTYPGCRVDVSNHFYSYSFAQDHDWPEYFSPQQVLLDYFRGCADEFGLREHIRFRTEVLRADFDDDRGSWSLTVRNADGSEEVLEANAVISAVGQLNRPSYPDIAGRERFAGPSFHSARWDHTVELRGKRVAVIGTGASAAQFIPAIAEDVAELVVFQRTPNWIVPTPDYHEAVSDGLRWLFRHVPYYSHWYRFWLFWRTTEGLLPAAKVDPEWQGDGRSLSEANELLRMLLTAYLESEFADRPDLLDKVIPDYPPAAKRILRDNGSWAQTIKRANVRLVSEKISEITEQGITTADGVSYDVDVVIYGTGFQASRFLTPMKVAGRGGIDLHERWGGDARAYLGLTVPEFPNLFLLYGPNTNIVVNGSIIYFSECEVHYVMECLRLLLERGAAAMSCRHDVHDAYNARIDAANRQMVWGASNVNSWYKNELGRVAQNWPYSLLDYWEQTREPDPDDYEFLPAPAPASSPAAGAGRA